MSFDMNKSSCPFSTKINGLHPFSIKLRLGLNSCAKFQAFVFLKISVF